MSRASDFRRNWRYSRRSHTGRSQLTGEEMAAYYTDADKSALEVWMGDSRAILQIAWTMADNAPDLNYVGWNVSTSQLDQPGVHDTVTTLMTANVGQTNSLIQPTWDLLGTVTKFLGGNTLSYANGCRLTQPANITLADHPNLWARIVGSEVGIRVWAFGCAGTVSVSPDVRVWHRTGADSSVIPSSPAGEYLDVSEIADGEYVEFSLTVPAGWSSSTGKSNVEVLEQLSAPTSADELLAVTQPQYELTRPGLSLLNCTVGGESLALHWCSSVVVPDAWFQEMIPRRANGRQVIARIDIGTNGGDADVNFIANMHALVARVRNVLPDAIVGIFTAYDNSVDTSSKTYVGKLYDAFNAGEFANAFFIDSRAGLDTYPVANAAGYMADGTHRNAAGHADQGAHLNTWITQMRAGGNYACRITTSLVANPYTHGVAGTIAGNCYPPTATIQILNNSGDVIATTAGVNGTWSTSITLPSAGSQNVSARCPNGFTTTRPTTVA